MQWNSNQISGNIFWAGLSEFQIWSCLTTLCSVIPVKQQKCAWFNPYTSISICSMMLNNKYGECGDKDNYLQSNTPLTLSGDKFPPSQLLHKLVRKCWLGHCKDCFLDVSHNCLTYVVSPSFQMVFSFATLQFIDSTIGYFACTIVNRWLWCLYRWKPIRNATNPWAPKHQMMVSAQDSDQWIQ